MSDPRTEVAAHVAQVHAFLDATPAPRAFQVPVDVAEECAAATPPAASAALMTPAAAVGIHAGACGPPAQELPALPPQTVQPLAQPNGSRPPAGVAFGLETLREEDDENESARASLED
eukprot:3461500-Prymnesium_polylepis.2